MALITTLHGNHGTSLSSTIGTWQDLKAAGRELMQVIHERTHPKPDHIENQPRVITPRDSATMDDIGDHAFATNPRKPGRSYEYDM